MGAGRALANRQPVRLCTASGCRSSRSDSRDDLAVACIVAWLGLQQGQQSDFAWSSRLQTQACWRH